MGFPFVMGRDCVIIIRIANNKSMNGLYNEAGKKYELARRRGCCCLLRPLYPREVHRGAAAAAIRLCNLYTAVDHQRLLGSFIKWYRIYLVAKALLKSQVPTRTYKSWLIYIPRWRSYTHCSLVRKTELINRPERK